MAVALPSERSSPFTCDRADDAAHTRPIWYDGFAAPTRPALGEHLTADVCDVGAGIAGLSVAYTLARAGKRVVVVDKVPIGSGESGRTTAHLSNAIDDRYVTLEKAHGADGARLAAESHTAAIDRIEQTVREEQIDCDFTRLDGYLFLGGEDTPTLLDEELAAAHRAGLTEVTRVERAPGVDSGPALRVPRQGRFHILEYLAGLADAIERHGGKIFCDSKVEKIEGGAPAMITTANGMTVAADDVVVCTNGAISDMVVTHTKQAPYRTFVVALAVAKGAASTQCRKETRVGVALQSEAHHAARLRAAGAGEGEHGRSRCSSPTTSCRARWMTSPTSRLEKAGG